MGKIGSFGDVAFKVSTKTVETFDGMAWESSAKYATHDRHIQADLLEYLGPELDTISFSMTLSACLGVGPWKEVTKLRKMARKGQVHRLVIGGKVYGSHKWAIEKCSIEMRRFDGQGRLMEAEAKLTLKEYPKR